MRDDTPLLASICCRSLAQPSPHLAEMVADLASRLAEANSFVLSSRMAKACQSAIDNKIPSDDMDRCLCRLPSHSIWIEWALDPFGSFGVLAEAADDRHNVGWMTLAFGNNDDVTISPLQVVFDWRSTPDLTNLIWDLGARPDEVQARRKRICRDHRLKDQLDDDGRRHCLVVHHTAEVMASKTEILANSGHLRGLNQSWHQEHQMVLAAVLLMGLGHLVNLTPFVIDQDLKQEAGRQSTPPRYQQVKLLDSVSTTGALKNSATGLEWREKIFGVFG